MASSSPGVYIIRGCRISLNLLQDVAADLPPPASAIVNLTQRAVSTAEEVKKNQEDTALLKDQLLQLLPVVLHALHEAKDIEIPVDLKQNLEKLQSNLEQILADITKVRDVVNSKRKRDKLVAAIKSGSYKEILQKSREDLDWAMRQFNVTTQLTNAVRLLEISRQVEAVAGQVEGVSVQVERIVGHTRGIAANVDAVFTNSVLDSLPRSKRASSACARPDRPEGCFQGTRIGLLDDIRQWMTNPDPSIPKCFWLSGIAGIGKTTVAYSVAELARSLGILGADFFFSRLGEDELRDPTLVFPTLAYQLALLDPDFSRAITAALHIRPDAGFISLKKQLVTLIVKPLSELQQKPNRILVLVLDAFDECEARGAKEILQLLVAALPLLPFFLKIFITSRPEPHIRAILIPSDNLHMTALHDIETSVVKEDIELYLTARLRGLPKELGLSGFGEDWITEAEIKVLADAAGTFFIYAATSIRFLSDALNLRKGLDALLKIIVSSPRPGSAGHLRAFFYLDQLYNQIVLSIITPTNEYEVTTLFQPVIGSVVLLRDPLPLPAIERLANLDEGDATDVLTRLHSVILPPGPPDYCPRIYHPSFPDFLQNRNRCTDHRLWIDTEKHEARLTICCLDIMNKLLHKNMLGKLDTTLLNFEVDGLDGKVQAAFPAELRYACLYWHSHLTALAYPESPAIHEALAVFVSRSLLPWLESMSWLGRTREAIQALETANRWVAKSYCPTSTVNLLVDGHRLLLTHFPTITSSALSIARSVLPFAPSNIQLASAYSGYADPIVTVVKGLEVEWSPCSMTLHGHSDQVNSIAVSPDGTRIASGSSDGTVRIWSTSSGDLISEMLGHSWYVRSVAYSVDGNRIASGSNDKTVRLWDATTGQDLFTMEGHGDCVNSVAFSADGMRIASGSDDKSIRIWNAATGTCHMSLEGYSAEVYSVAFVPDGRRVVSGSEDGVVRVWDLESKTCILSLDGHSSEVSSVAVSPDGSRIASGSTDTTIQIWDTTGGNCLTTLRDSHHVYSVAFSLDGSRVVSSSEDHSLRLWDTTYGLNIATFTGHAEVPMSAVFVPNSPRVASGSYDNTVKMWEVNSSNNSKTKTSRTGQIRSLAFSPDGTRLVSMNWSNKVQIWDTTDGHEILSFPVQAPFFLLYGCRADFSLDGTRIVVTFNKARLVFDALNGAEITDPEASAAKDVILSEDFFDIQGGRVFLCVGVPSIAFTLPPSHQISNLTSAALGGGKYCVAYSYSKHLIAILQVAL